jgi:hypothetical protein
MRLHRRIVTSTATVLKEVAGEVLDLVFAR